MVVPVHTTVLTVLVGQCKTLIAVSHFGQANRPRVLRYSELQPYQIAIEPKFTIKIKITYPDGTEKVYRTPDELAEFAFILSPLANVEFS